MTEPTRNPVRYYGYGRTSVFACQADQRFSYCLYVPEEYDSRATTQYPLVVAVHGTERGFQYYRDSFAKLAQERRCIVLAPLFPIGINKPDELENYKFIEMDGIRFDLLLLQMIDEVGEVYRLDSERLLMYGFSGGGHFTHRFFMLHPSRLRAISIGAPGVVTLLDDRYDFWAGTRDVEERFGAAVDFEAMRRVAVHMLIGEGDTETWEIAMSPDDEWWIDGAELQGKTRLDRMAALRRSYEAQGIQVTQDIVPGIAHDDRTMLEPVMEFFARYLDCY